ncbi:hypothetical protein Tco_0489669 [Tanacetum coccineum]
MIGMMVLSIGEEHTDVKETIMHSMSTVPNSGEEDSVGKPLYSRFIKTNNFKGVPHPLSGDYTPKPQEEINESLYVYGSIGTSSEHSLDPESEISRVPPEVYVSTPITTNEKGNKDQLEDFEEFNGGSVTFGGSKGYISGKGEMWVGTTSKTTVNASGRNKLKTKATFYYIRAALTLSRADMKLMPSVKECAREVAYKVKDFAKKMGTWKMSQLKNLSFEEVKEELYVVKQEDELVKSTLLNLESSVIYFVDLKEKYSFMCSEVAKAMLIKSFKEDTDEDCTNFENDGEARWH